MSRLVAKTYKSEGVDYRQWFCFLGSFEIFFVGNFRRICKKLDQLELVAHAVKNQLPFSRFSQPIPQLTHLCIRPLGNEMCDSITGANFQLQEFETVFADRFISESKYLDIFPSQSFDLKKLSLKTYGLSKEQCRKIVIAHNIKSTLPTAS